MFDFLTLDFVKHFPVIAVMGLFLCAFLVEIFGAKNKYIRNTITLVAAFGAFALIASLIKPIFGDGEILSYWMGNWNGIGIAYEIDALSLFFGLLVVTTVLLSAIYSMKYMARDHHLGHYYTLFLMLSGSVLGLVLTGDIFNMFVMIEIMTFASVALTAFRNNKFGALEAGFKYLIIGSIGSSMTLAGIALLYAQCHTLNMAQISASLAGGLTPTTILAFALMFAGFGVKSYMVPFHAPAADAYMTAPTSISMVFSGMVNKAGVYGMIRLIYVIFRAMELPAFQVMLATFGTVTMFIGVTMALAQHDFKRLLAFHSISQVGYILTAISLGTALGLEAGLFHAMNHTLFKGLLFLTAGAVLYAAGTTDLDKLGGLAKKMPKTAICFLIGAFSISGLPPFNGFASKWMIYQATFEKAVTPGGNFAYAFFTVVALVVSVMTLASFIKVTQAVFFGQLPSNLRDVKEVPFAMRAPMWIMSALCILTGVFYSFVQEKILIPAADAVFSVTSYVDKMMGDGVASAWGVADYAQSGIDGIVNIWNPVLWLILFAIVLIAVFIVILTGDKERGEVLEMKEEDGEDGKFATFFGGEKSVHSHVSGSDLFWGFKHDFKGYFKFIGGMHSGVVNDYALWAVVGAALITVFMFVMYLFV